MATFVAPVSQTCTSRTCYPNAEDALVLNGNDISRRIGGDRELEYLERDLMVLEDHDSG